MMAGNHNWLNVHPPSMISPQFVLGSPSVSLNSLTDSQETIQPWSQMLLTGLTFEEDRTGLTHFQTKKLENWDDQILNSTAARVPFLDAIKHEVSHSNGLYGHGHEEFQGSGPVWSHSRIVPISSPRSCVTSLSNNMLDFTYNNADRRNQLPDHASERDSAAHAAICKKARVQSSSCQPPLKVRKEKLGDRITALHQLVSPFGKTDTASVLLEAIGYIRFLQGQIEALSSPYLGSASKNIRNRQSANGERNCVFPEDPGQLLNDTCLKRKAAPNQDTQDEPKDLRCRGLCLVPVSCTQNVGSDNGADYWAPAYGGGF